MTTKIPVELSSTPGIVDGSNATAITINSSEQVGIGTTSPSRIFDVENSSASALCSIVSGTALKAGFVFGDTSADDQGGIVYDNNGDYLFFRAGGAERARILSGGGITFNGDTAAANALDDYEEGTFTPTFSTSNSTSTGSYTKVGNKVTVHFHVVSTGGLPSGGSQVQIGNFPFTSGSGFRGAGSLYIGPSNVSSAVGGGGTIVPIMQGSEAFVRLVNIDTGTLGYTLWGELEVSHNNVVTAIGTMTYTV